MPKKIQFKSSEEQEIYQIYDFLFWIMHIYVSHIRKGSIKSVQPIKVVFKVKYSFNVKVEVVETVRQILKDQYHRRLDKNKKIPSEGMEGKSK